MTSQAIVEKSAATVSAAPYAGWQVRFRLLGPRAADAPTKALACASGPSHASLQLAKGSYFDARKNLSHSGDSLHACMPYFQELHATWASSNGDTGSWFQPGDSDNSESDNTILTRST